jgi:serine O-acetyltransferase
MNKDFLQHLFDKQRSVEAIPTNREISEWATHVISLLYPERAHPGPLSVAELEARFDLLEKELVRILNGTQACTNCNNGDRSRAFFRSLPDLYHLLNSDVAAILQGDPAATSESEIIRAYPGFAAISFYRVAHSLLQQEVPLLPRVITEYAHSQTGIDIHPGASIGEHFFIDHGTGIVIGETTRIGNHVKLYQGVTLGALSVNKNLAHTKRHPTVEDHVVIYSGATILGGETVVGHHSVIGGNVWLTTSVPPGSLVFHNPEITVLEGKILN